MAKRNKARHYDDKRDLIATMKENQRRADHAVAASFSAYMIIGTLTLFEDLNFRETRIRKFVNGFYKRLDLYHAGVITREDMERVLYDKAGIVIEPPRIEK